jgi:hypothetical protein
MLSKYTIKCVGLPPKKTSNLLHQVQDDFGLKTPGIYTIHCKCEVYIGQQVILLRPRKRTLTTHTVGTTTKIGGGEHSCTQDHVMQLHNTKIPCTKSGYMDPLITEAIKLEL